MRRQSRTSGLLSFLCMIVLLGAVVGAYLFGKGQPPAGTSPLSGAESIRW